MNRFVTLRILWGAILSSSVLLFAVMTVVAPEQGPPDPVLVAALGLVALTTSAASIVLPRFIFRQGLRRLRLSTREERDPTQIEGLAGRTVLANPAAAADAVTALFATPFVIGLALAESIGIHGFVLGFLGLQTTYVVPFFVLSWGLLAAQFPTPERVLGSAERVTGLSFQKSA